MNDIVNIISSSSGGNSYIYNKDILLDIGVNFKKIQPYIKDIKLVLLTHVHGDHLNKNTLKKLLYERPTIKIVCCFWLVDELLKIGIDKKSIYVLELEKKYDLGKYIIEPIPAIHDKPNCGYKIMIKENNYKIFHITDTNSIDHIIAKDYNLYMIEANYTDEEELENRIKQDYDNGLAFSHYERVKKTHLSQLKAYNWLQKNMNKNSEFVFLHEHVDKERKEENVERI